MKKIHKKFLAVFFIVFFIGIAGFFYLPAKGVTLEVEYPKLQTGATVTSSSDLTQYLKYVFDFGISIGFLLVFLSLTWAGVLYLVSPASPEAVAKARDRAGGAISGLLILALLYLIITTINPQLNVFNLDPLEPIPPAPEQPPEAGVYFYNSTDCSGTGDLNTSNADDLGGLKNKINSVKIVPNDATDTYYVSVLYDVFNRWGKCQYINPNADCFPVAPFSASASIHKYDFNPDGEGVYLYRKSFFNENGGGVKISNSLIKNSGSEEMYVEGLNNLKFTGNSTNSSNIDDCTVPKDEQACEKYDKNGICAEKTCPDLSGENISSIKISGDYIVLLIYFGPSDESEGTWTYCQEFPTKDDANKEGPNQIKWEPIRNTGQTPDPNYIMIIPVVEK